MSDLMLVGVLNMPLPDDPSELGVIEWVQFRDRARQAAQVIDALPDKIDIYRAIKASGARKHADIAQVVADLYTLRDPSTD